MSMSELNSQICKLSRFYSLICSLVLLGASPGAERVALVIGNDQYQHLDNLEKPQNDTKAVADALRKLDFEVVFKSNLTSKSFRDELDQFHNRLASAKLALVYYSGHGLEIDGKNYLLPIDAELAGKEQLSDQTIALDLVLNGIKKSKDLANILILDCCRVDPIHYLTLITRTKLAKPFLVLVY